MQIMIMTYNTLVADAEIARKALDIRYGEG